MAVNVPTASELVAELERRFENFFGVDELNTSPDTPNGQLIRIWTHMLLTTYQVGQYIFSASRFNQAQGDDLSSLLSLLGIVRRNTSVRINSVSLTGEPNTLLPAGSLAATTSTETQPQGYLFYLESDVTFNEQGMATGNFIQDTESTITRPILAGELNKVVSILKDVTGRQIWTGVNNANAGISDNDVETDNQFRRRASTFTARFSAGYISNMRAWALTTPSAYNITVYENTGDKLGAHPDLPDGMPINSTFIIGAWRADIQNSTPLQQRIADILAPILPPVESWDGTPATGTPAGENQFKVNSTLPTGQNVGVGFATAKQANFGLWVYLNSTSDLVRTREVLLGFLNTVFDNPAPGSNSHDAALNNRGMRIGASLIYDDFACRLRELGADGLFEVENVFISDNYQGDSTVYHTETLQITPDTFLQFTDMNNDATTPQLALKFNAPDE